MKIVIISNLYPPYQRGGAEIIAKHIAMSLSMKDEGQDEGQSNEVSVISTTSEKGFFVEKLENLTIYRFKPKNLFYYLSDYKYSNLIRAIWRLIDIFNFHSYFIVKKILNDIKPDVVITHNLTGIGYLLPLLLKKLSIRHIHTLHDVQLLEPSGILTGVGNLNNSILYKVYRQITKQLFKSIDIVISPSNALLDLHTSKKMFINAEKVCLRNPSLKPQATQNNLINLPFKNQVIKYLYIGQIERHKGVLDLIMAFRLIDNPNIELTIIGNGSEFSAIQQQAWGDDRIKILGKIKHSKISEYIQNNHFVIIPSLAFENSPTVIYESFASGRPVLASHVGGIPELVNKNNGFLFNPLDIKDFVETIKYSYSLDDDEYQLLCKNAFSFADEVSLDSYILKLKTFLK